MSDAKWCDVGKHAFSANDPKRETFQRQRQVNNVTVKHSIDVCGDHMKAMPGAENLPELTEGVPRDE